MIIMKWIQICDGISIFPVVVVVFFSSRVYVVPGNISKGSKQLKTTTKKKEEEKEEEFYLHLVEVHSANNSGSMENKQQISNNRTLCACVIWRDFKAKRNPNNL